MSSQQPQDPYGQDPYGQQQQGYPPAYGQQQPYSGYQAPAAPRQPLDMSKVVYIAAWVVLALFGLAYFYALAQDEILGIGGGYGGPDFADRFFGGMPLLGEGILFSGILHGIAMWMERQKGAV
jgi:hypothetical protein